MVFEKPALAPSWSTSDFEISAIFTSSMNCCGAAIDSILSTFAAVAEPAAGAAAGAPTDNGDGLPALWPQAARGSQGFAWRAAMAETVAANRH